jgi:DNA-binding transcriptional regulator GbsR (MarR family)
MNSLQEIRAGFIRIYEDIVRAKGLPAIMGRILAVLFLEGRELSHKEVSSLTGYSMASVNRTLNQLVNMGMVHKHKDPLKKHFVFHTSIDFPELFADSLEKMMQVYRTQRNEINELTQKLDSLQSKGNEQAEIKHVRTVLNKFDRVLEVAMEALENVLKDLRSNERYLFSPEK